MEPVTLSNILRPERKPEARPPVRKNPAKAELLDKGGKGRAHV
jgi:hypothetical protein